MSRLTKTDDTEDIIANSIEIYEKELLENELPVFKIYANKSCSPIQIDAFSYNILDQIGFKMGTLNDLLIEIKKEYNQSLLLLEKKKPVGNCKYRRKDTCK